jgi:hypothetical protein
MREKEYSDTQDDAILTSSPGRVIMPQAVLNSTTNSPLIRELVANEPVPGQGTTNLLGCATNSAVTLLHHIVSSKHNKY